MGNDPVKRASHNWWLDLTSTLKHFNQPATSSFLAIWYVFPLTIDHNLNHEHVQNLICTISSILVLTFRLESALFSYWWWHFYRFSKDALTVGICFASMCVSLALLSCCWSHFHRFSTDALAVGIPADTSRPNLPCPYIYPFLIPRCRSTTLLQLSKSRASSKYGVAQRFGKCALSKYNVAWSD